VPPEPPARAFVPPAPTPQEPPPGTDTFALAAQGGDDQARRVVLALVQAMLERDVHALGSLFAERVTVVREGRRVARDDAARRCLRAGQRAAWQTETRAEDAVDMDSLEVRRADAVHATSGLPPGIRATDLFVEPTLLPAFHAPGQRYARTCLDGIYVRAGHRPDIVGLER
jgi:hypothetical protein